MSMSEKIPVNNKKLSPEDRKAALDLAKENPILMDDPAAKYVIEHDGKTPDGREVESIEDFLDGRMEWLKKNPPHLSSGKRHLSPDVGVDHSKTWQDKESQG